MKGNRKSHRNNHHRGCTHYSRKTQRTRSHHEADDVVCESTGG
ncbi:hypothetical protein [Methanosarcina acetivorans]|nr:hypothetical protein [Methanosarcina acetivorans]